MPKLLPVGFAAALLVSGCATAPAIKGSALGLDSSIQDIVANPAGKAVLDKDLPGLTIDPSYDLFKGMSLKQMAPMSHGRLSDAVLKSVAEDLAAVPK